MGIFQLHVYNLLFLEIYFCAMNYTWLCNIPYDINNFYQYILNVYVYVHICVCSVPNICTLL